MNTPRNISYLSNKYTRTYHPNNNIKYIYNINKLW